ncbi:hypothetical protein BH09BAC1_BH09BAC1_25100 [soil metagenome]
MQSLRLNPWYYIPYLLVLIVAGIFLLLNPKGTFLLWVNRHHTPLLDTFFLTTNALGEWIFASVVVGALMIFTSYAAGLAGALAWGLAGSLTQTLKHFAFGDVARPFRHFQGIQDVYFVPGVQMYEHFSFPSGHTTVAFALCTVLALSVKNRKWGVLFFVMAMVAGLSRIYLAQHFLVDTYFGSLIGTTVGFIVYTALHKFLSYRPHHVLHRNVLKSLRG